jgi:hypothetical protein
MPDALILSPVMELEIAPAKLLNLVGAEMDLGVSDKWNLPRNLLIFSSSASYLGGLAFACMPQAVTHQQCVTE